MIAYTHGEAPVTSIFVVNADGTRRTNVSSDADSNNTPAWSPNGTEVAFSSNMYPSGSRLNHTEIYVMDADSTNLRRLTHNLTYDTDPSCSPDGTKVAYTGYGKSGFEIYTVDADSSNETRITDSPENADDINHSGNLGRYQDNSDTVCLPGGKKIAFRVDSRPPGRAGIYTMNPDGSDQALVTDDGDQPDWSPDSTKIAYRASPPRGKVTPISTSRTPTAPTRSI
jgi:TolB protein